MPCRACSCAVDVAHGKPSAAWKGLALQGSRHDATFTICEVTVHAATAFLVQASSSIPFAVNGTWRTMYAGRGGSVERLGDRGAHERFVSTVQQKVRSIRLQPIPPSIGGWIGDLIVCGFEEEEGSSSTGLTAGAHSPSTQSCPSASLQAGLWHVQHRQTTGQGRLQPAFEWDAAISKAPWVTEAECKQASSIAAATTDGRSLILSSNSDVQPRVYLARNPREPLEYHQFTSLVGGTISFTMDVSGIACGCVSTMYLASLPARDASGGRAAGPESYCDAPGWAGYACPELDLVEANRFALAVTLHREHTAVSQSRPRPVL